MNSKQNIGRSSWEGRFVLWCFCCYFIIIGNRDYDHTQPCWKSTEVNFPATCSCVHPYCCLWLEKPIVWQLLKLSARARHWTRQIQSTPLHPICLWSILILSTHLQLCLPSCLICIFFLKLCMQSVGKCLYKNTTVLLSVFCHRPSREPPPLHTPCSATELRCFIRICKQSAPLRVLITFLVSQYSQTPAYVCHCVLCFLGNRHFLDSVFFPSLASLHTYEPAYVLTQHCWALRCRHVQEPGCFANVATLLVLGCVDCLYMTESLSDETTCLSFTVGADPRQRSHNRILLSHIWSRSHITTDGLSTS
jgi:hypothetical protein